MSLHHPVVDLDPRQLDPGHRLNKLSEAGAPDDEAEVDDPLHRFHIHILTGRISSPSNAFSYFGRVTVKTQCLSVYLSFPAPGLIY